LCTGGGRAGGDLASGFFVEPTVFADADPTSPLVREEIFGPVLAVLPFDDEEEAVRLANDTDYGLAASIWTRDISTAHKLAKKIRAGSVRINTAGTVDAAMPLGGYKQSGWGRENGREGTEIYTEVKSVTVGL
ncbi:MAG: aldehyde dehydrogenase family protein, partial [Panacagrimonas sp.]